MRIPLVVIFSLATLSAQQIVPPGARYPFPPDPKRDPWQKPDQVIAALNFRSSETVAVIESGYPYFAPRIAGLVKTVYAVNSDPQALQGPLGSGQGFSPVISTAAGPNISSLDVDTVFMVDVLRLIPEQQRYFLGVLAGLKPTGRLVIIDRIAPPVYSTSFWITAAALKSELSPIGFGLIQQYTFLNYQYFLVFQR